MRIIYLPNKIYKLYDYAKRHNIWHAYREKYGKLINDYTYLRTQYKVTHKGLQEQLGISRWRITTVSIRMNARIDIFY